MDLSATSSRSFSQTLTTSSFFSKLPKFKSPLFLFLPHPNLRFEQRNSFSKNPLVFPRESAIKAAKSTQNGDDGFVLEDVPHLTDYLSDLPVYPNPLQSSPAYAIVKQQFVNSEDVVAQRIVVQKNSPRGLHFRRAGPREKVYFKSENVRACIVTCGGLCPGINTVIREIVCGLNYMYGVNDILGIEGGYRGFYSRNTISLTPKVVNDIHKRGGTFLRTSRGGHDTVKILDSIQDRGINQVYIIGGDGTQRGAYAIYEEIEKRKLPVAVAGIPKTIDNDIADCCLIPESPFYLEGEGGLFEFVEQRLKENGHMVIVLAEGAGQEHVAQTMHANDEKDASGNRLLLDVGPWLTQKIKDHFVKDQKMAINLKYIDPTYMIRAIPSNASDNIYCTLLAHSAVHGAMAGYSGFTVGPVNSRHAYIPIAQVTKSQKTVKLTDRMWARLLASTNQPYFLRCNEVMPQGVDKETAEMMNNMRISSVQIPIELTDSQGKDIFVCP